MLESDNDLMNSTANPQIYQSRFIPPGRDKSYPNVSGSGFRDESFNDDAEPQLQSLERSIDVTLAKFDESFERLKKEWSVREKKQIAYCKIIRVMDNISSKSSPMETVGEDLFSSESLCFLLENF